jgi:dihydroneopterin aldolase
MKRLSAALSNTHKDLLNYKNFYGIMKNSSEAQNVKLLETESEL